MPPQGHDPVERLNARHRRQLRAVARTFGGQPDAGDVRATAIDDAGLSLDVATPSGTEAVRISFSDALPDLEPDTSMRMAFRRLAKLAETTDA